MLSWQIDRLYVARSEVLAAQEQSRAAHFYGHEHADAFRRLHGEAHFVVVAARQLLRALRAFDGNDRLPGGLGSDHLRALRDAMEHWDDPDGWASKRLAAIGAEASAHQWSDQGPGLLGKIVLDAELKAWADSTYEELVAWDPW